MTDAEDGVQFLREDARRKLSRVGTVILVGSGKGGVGKSFIAASLALTLSSRGHRTGILDLDLHGTSLSEYFEVAPPLVTTKGGLKPKTRLGLEIMSLGLLTGNHPVPMRGDEKEVLLNQMFALTDWGRLDYLVVDLPPSTGDELLSAFEMFASKSVLILVTTPSSLAVKVVSRVRQLARSEGIMVQGIVVNMAYQNYGPRRMYPFGRLGRASLEKSLDAKIVAEIPLEPRVSSQSLTRILATETGLATAFSKLASRVEISGRNIHRTL